MATVNPPLEPISQSPIPTPPLPWHTRVFYGMGAMAFGIKSNGFDYFLLAFYSQVVGLDPRLVGLALFISLLFDAVSDPLVGYWSDNLRSRWGRRHPFMYGAAIPVALCFFLVWMPPESFSDTETFWYLLCLSVLIRTSITFFETPNIALAPELTQDYNDRSRLISYAHFFAWSGGNFMNIAMLFIVFPLFVTGSMSEAVSSRAPYTAYGVIASVLIFISIMVSSAGTHSRIPTLYSPPQQRKLTVPKIFKEIFETLANRSFVSIFAASMLGAMGLGLKASLHLYFVSYFWEFTPAETGYLSIGIFLSAFIGFKIAPFVSERMGKKNGAIIVGLVAFVAAPIPICMRLFDMLPANGDPIIFWFNLIFGIVDLGLIICFNILVASMLADLAEQSELETGRRSEGILAAAITFAKKSVQGLGVLMASFVLTLAQFPKGVSVDDVSDQAIWDLGAYFVPIVTAIYLVMIGALTSYKLSKEDFEENLRRLQDRTITEHRQ